MGLVFFSIQPVCVSVGPFYPFLGKVIIAMHDTIIYFIIHIIGIQGEERKINSPLKKQ